MSEPDLPHPRAPEVRFLDLVDAIPIGIYELDAEGRVLLANSSFARITGYPVDELVGMTVDELMAPGPARDATPALFQSLVADTPEPTPIDAENRTRDGRSIFVRVHWDYLRDAEGRVTGFMCAVEDATDRVRAAHELRMSEERFRQMFEQAPFGTVAYAPDGKARFVNAPQMAMMGLSDEQMGFLLEHYNILEDEQLAALGLRPFIEQGFAGAPTALPPVRYEPRKMHPPVDQDSRWIRGFVYPLKDESGKVREVVVTLEDITEAKEAEERQNALETRIQQAQKQESLSVLAGGIAHDFNNLLEAILGNADLALLDVPQDSPLSGPLEDIVNGATRAADLVRQMLAYSGQTHIAKEALDLTALVEEVDRLVGATVSKKAHLEKSLRPDLPLVEADATQLRQVIMNLVINASEALGGEAGTISIRTGVKLCDETYLAESYLDDDLPAGLYCYFEVADTGLGMGPETRARIFEPFFSTKFTGRGLGLAAALGIVRRHGGAVRLDSELGRGTTFRVLLPPSPGAPDARVERRDSPEWSGQGTFLVVDDEDGVRRVAARMLRRLGFEVVAVADGRAALDLVGDEPGRFVGVLLDLAMPEMDGVECLRALQAADPELPVLIGSGYGASEVERQLGRIRPAGIVHKPFALAALSAAIRAFLEAPPH